MQRFAKPPSLLETLKAWNGMKNPEERDRQQLRVLISWQEQAASRHRQDIAALPFQAAYHQQQPASPNTPHPDTGNEWQRRAKEWANNPDSRKMFDCVSYHEAINHFNQLSQQGSSQNQAA
ncbi:MAG TPA: hypothetical protein VLE96_01505, partial [Chlamydiales bacterium]|nr:hypothetical protein [Chlamydiales bacterium]